MHPDEKYIAYCTEEEHMARCSMIRWGYYGDRRSCEAPATHFMGDAGYGWQGRFGFCTTHWEWMQRAVKYEITGARDGDWILDTLMRRARYDYLSALDSEQRKRRAEAAELRAQLLDGRYFGKDFVYFIQVGDDGPIKIGTTRDVRMRLAALQTASPFPLNLRALQPGGAPAEANYHRVFEEHRMNGEWFQPVPELLDVIDRINDAADTPTHLLHSP